MSYLQVEFEVHINVLKGLQSLLTYRRLVCVGSPNLGRLKFYKSLSFESNKNRSWEKFPLVERSLFTRGTRSWIFFEGAVTVVTKWWWLSEPHHTYSFSSFVDLSGNNRVVQLPFFPPFFALSFAHLGWTRGCYSMIQGDQRSSWGPVNPTLWQPNADGWRCELLKILYGIREIGG